jgi:hypothetical protein
MAARFANPAAMDQHDATADLREKILGLTYVCPKGEYTTDCPFAVLKGLSRDSRITLLAQMDRGRLLGLFDLPSSCACLADPRKQSGAVAAPPVQPTGDGEDVG